MMLVVDDNINIFHKSNRLLFYLKLLTPEFPMIVYDLFHPVLKHYITHQLQLVFIWFPKIFYFSLNFYYHNNYCFGETLSKIYTTFLPLNLTTHLFIVFSFLFF